MALPFHYHHDRAHPVDVVLRFAYDPAVLSPAALVPADGAADVAWEAGVARPGEYWARLQGPVPAGSGQIAWIPFRLVEDAQVTASLGSVTLYHP